MQELLRILENQQEVKYLTYFVSQDRLGTLKIKLGAAGIEKMYKFSDENACLTKIIDILFKLKQLEAWNLKRTEKQK